MPHPADADLCRIVCRACPPYGRAYPATSLQASFGCHILKFLIPRLLCRILRMPTSAGLSARHALPTVVHTGLRCLQASSRKPYYGGLCIHLNINDENAIFRGYATSTYFGGVGVAGYPGGFFKIFPSKKSGCTGGTATFLLIRVMNYFTLRTMLLSIPFLLITMGVLLRSML